MNENEQGVQQPAETQKSSRMRVAIIVGSIVFLCMVSFGFAYYFFIQRSDQGTVNDGGSTDKDVTSGAVTGQGEVPFMTSSKFVFAPFELEETPYVAQVPSYTIAVKELPNLGAFEKATKKAFSAEQKTALEKSYFFIQKNTDRFFGDDPKAISMRTDDWTQLYDEIGGAWDAGGRLPENAVFVSSDYLLHVYHRLLEKEFEYIEQKEFYPRLVTLSQTLLENSITAYNKSNEQDKKESYQRLIAYFLVPTAILESAYEDFSAENFTNTQSDAAERIMANVEKRRASIPERSYNDAKAEITLIMAAKEIQDSPLYGAYRQAQGVAMPEDYTQFGPRSHYNKNAVLRTYFRAMMWYGRQNLLASSPELTRDAMNITLMMQDAQLRKAWDDIYIPTAFFVGESDDLGITEYAGAMEQVFGKNIAFDTVSIAKMQEKMKNYKNPQIMSSVAVGQKVTDMTKEELQNTTKGFRFMGQRFTPDAFVFSTLTQGDEKPDPETGEKLPSMPTALQVMTVLGNDTAQPLTDQWIAQNAPASKNVLAKKMGQLEQHFGALDDKAWTQNIYWSWLYTITSLFRNHENLAGYPMFVQSAQWDKKNLQSALGSWTELKHDTLLYAKQSYAEMGAGFNEETPPPVPKGYVEPNIEFYDRLLALTKMTRTGLESRQLLPNEFVGRTDSFVASVNFFRDIAVKELANQTISDDEFERLRREPAQLNSVIRPLPGEDGTEDQARAALIADVHTDMISGEILYEATGIPNYIYVAVKDANGVRLTKGLVYAYYEFTHPIGERLTDEKWKEWQYANDQTQVSPVPTWTQELVK
ncbi:MAG: DUF3160 domain-containing protein [Parcubacteria group bacterium]|jgi:hypothetical protein